MGKLMRNSVELVGFYGGDRTHSMSAWTSTSREITDSKEKRIPELLKMLAENNHHTPFEKSTLHFLVTTDIASHIHLIKHRVGTSVNAESARYKELKEDKFYIPEDFKGIKGLNIDGEYADWADILTYYNNLGNTLYHECIKDLVAQGIDRKRAKESARYFKTYSSQITSDVMFNFRSFAHFQGLRNKPDAQKEIREIANEMLIQVENIEGNPFKYTLEAFNMRST